MVTELAHLAAVRASVCLCDRRGIKHRLALGRQRRTVPQPLEQQRRAACRLNKRTLVC